MGLTFFAFHNIFEGVLRLLLSFVRLNCIRQGPEDVASGRTRPAREVLDEIRAEYDIPR